MGIKISGIFNVKAITDVLNQIYNMVNSHLYSILGTLGTGFNNVVNELYLIRINLIDVIYQPISTVNKKFIGVIGEPNQFLHDGYFYVWFSDIITLNASTETQITFITPKSRGNVHLSAYLNVSDDDDRTHTQGVLFKIYECLDLRGDGNDTTGINRNRLNPVSSVSETTFQTGSCNTQTLIYQELATREQNLQPKLREHTEFVLHSEKFYLLTAYNTSPNYQAYGQLVVNFYEDTRG